MPRIRTLKPEHKQHRKIGPLDDRTYRLWVGMLTEADDDGRVVADPGQLKVLIFGYRTEVTVGLIEDSLNTLFTLDLCHVYDIGGVQYACFHDFNVHQKINRPTPSKLPPCPCLTEPSRNTHGALTEDSPRIGSYRIKDQGSDLRGGDRKGRDVGDASPTPPLVAHASSSDNGHSPDKWPTDPALRKAAMLAAFRSQMQHPPALPPEPDPAPF